MPSLIGLEQNFMAEEEAFGRDVVGSGSGSGGSSNK
jgi:hypothetical protein